MNFSQLLQRQAECSSVFFREEGKESVLDFSEFIGKRGDVGTAVGCVRVGVPWRELPRRTLDPLSGCPLIVILIYRKGMQRRMNVCVTGACGKIAYSLLNPLCAGDIFGRKVHVHLRLLDLSSKHEQLRILREELDDCCFECVTAVEIYDEKDK